MSARRILDYINIHKKMYPNCEQQHSMGLSPGLNINEKASETFISIYLSLCFWSTGTM